MKRSAVMTVVAGILFAGLVGAEGAAAADRTSVAALPGPAQAAVAGALGRDSALTIASARPTADCGSPTVMRSTPASTRAGCECARAAPRSGYRWRHSGAAPRCAQSSPARVVLAPTGLSTAGPGVTEWYVNGPLGLEHGFTLLRRPAAVAAAGRGGHARARSRRRPLARLDADRRGLALIDRAGRERLAYRGLWATDADGRELRAWLALARGRLLVRVDDTGARYPLTIDPYFQGGKL